MLKAVPSSAPNAPAETAVPDAKAFGVAIRDRRKALGLTQTTLAGLSGVSHKFVNEVERGKETAEIGKVLRVARMLGLDLLARPR